jgi:hypothetical protein
MDDAPAADLCRALAAIGRTQRRWLADLEACCAGEPRFQDAFRRWLEWLTLLRLHLVRAEGRLLHLLVTGPELRGWREFPHPLPSLVAARRDWEARLPPWLATLHLETGYLRLERCRDLDDEAVPADIATDFCTCAAIATVTGAAIEHLDPRSEPAWLEDMAFHHVICPWRLHGAGALRDVLRWCEEFMIDESEL